MAQTISREQAEGLTSRQVAEQATEPAPSLAPAQVGQSLRLRPATELLGRFEGGGTADPTYLVRRPDGQVIHLSALLHLVCSAIGVDPGADLDDLAAEISRRFGRTLDGDDLRHVVESKLQPAGIVEWIDPRRSTPGAPTDTPVATVQANPLLALRLRAGLVPEPVHRRITTLLTVAFRLPVLVAGLAAFATVEGWLVVSQRRAVYEAFLTLARSPLLLLAVAALTVASAAFHELGHAAAARYGGARPGSLGVGVYLVWPVFFTDVTDAYKLDRRGRLRTDLGGIYFNLLFMVGVAAAYLVRPSPPLLAFLVLGQTETLRQFLPVIRLDGYYIVSDLAGVPNLFSYLGPVMVSLTRAGDDATRRAARARLADLTPRARRLITTWVCVTAPVLALNLGILLFLAPHFLGAAWAGLTADMATARAALAAGQPAAAAQAGLEAVLLAAPALGFGYIFVLVVRRAAAAVVRWYRRRPRLTTAGVAGLAALVAAQLVLVWPAALRSSMAEARQGGATEVAADAPDPAPSAGSDQLGSAPADPLPLSPDGPLTPIPTVGPPPTTPTRPATSTSSASSATRSRPATSTPSTARSQPAQPQAQPPPTTARSR